VRKFGLTQFVMLAPALGLLIFIILLPSLYVFWLSFTESTYGKAPVFVGLENYVAIWNDRYFWRALINTLIVVATNPGVFADVDKWISKLDIPVKITAGSTNNYVYRLKYGRAETVAMAIMALYSGNPISEGPAWVILNAIFGSRTRFFLLAPAYAALFAAIVWRTTGAAGAATLALLVALASTGLWESSFGGDLAAAGFAMASGTLLCLLAPTRLGLAVVAAVLIGAVATVRLPFVVFPILAALLLVRARASRAATVVLIVGIVVAVGSHALFWGTHPGEYPPLHLVGQSAGSVGALGLAVAALLAAGVVGLLWRSWLLDGADVLFWQGVALFGPFAIVAWQSVATVGLTGEDWTRYLAPALPSFAAAVAIGTYRIGEGRQAV